MKWTKTNALSSLRLSFVSLLLLSLGLLNGIANATYQFNSNSYCDTADTTRSLELSRNDWVAQAKTRVEAAGGTLNLASTSTNVALVRFSSDTYRLYVTEGTARIRLTDSGSLTLTIYAGASASAYNVMEVRPATGTVFTSTRTNLAAGASSAASSNVNCHFAIANAEPTSVYSDPVRYKFPYSATQWASIVMSPDPFATTSTGTTGGTTTVSGGATIAEQRSLLHEYGVKAAGFGFACLIGLWFLSQFRFKPHA